MFVDLLFPSNCTVTKACGLNVNVCKQASSSTSAQHDLCFVQSIVHATFVAEADSKFVAGHLESLSVSSLCDYHNSNLSSDCPKIYLLVEVKVYQHDRKAEWYLRGAVCSVRLCQSSRRMIRFYVCRIPLSLEDSMSGSDLGFAFAT